MVYRVLAATTMAVHFAFLAFVVFGGFLAWRWPRAIVPHLLAAGWGAVILAFSVDCPLAYVEAAFRRRAGLGGLPGGFIDHYIEGVLYPQRYAALVRVLALVVVAGSWLGAYLRSRSRRGRTAPSTMTQRVTR